MNSHKCSTIAKTIVLLLALLLAPACGEAFIPVDLVNGSFDTRFYTSGTAGGNISDPRNVLATVVDERTGNLFIGGIFTSVDNVPAYNIAFYDVTTKRWSSLKDVGLESSGLSEVSALAISGNDLYVGGRFTKTHVGSTPGLNNIARYDIDSKVWSAILPGFGLNNQVRALATSASGNDLYVGGDFTATGDGTIINLNRIVRYDIAAGSWTPFNENGLNGAVRALEFSTDGNDLFVGGDFTRTVDNPAQLNRIARYNGSNWSPLNNGLNSTVYALEFTSGGLFVGGNFTTDGVIALNRIARHNGVSWSPLFDNTLDGAVRALASYNDNLYLGGDFNGSLNPPISTRIARYGISDGLWESFPFSGLNNSVYTIRLSNDGLDIGGTFTEFAFSSPFSFSGIVHFNLGANNNIASPSNATLTGTWSQLGLNNGIALNDSVTSLAAGADGNIYLGGFFTQTADGAINLNSIARFNPATNTWSALANNGLNGVVRALAISGDNLYVAGSFTSTHDGVVGFSNIARYNLTTNTWSALTDNGLDSEAYALAISGDNLYVGGFFTQTLTGATTNLNKIARYNTATNTWSALANNGLNSTVNALAVSGDNLYVGGSFSRTVSVVTPALINIARYNTVTNVWSALANNGLNNTVKGLAVANNFLFVNGNFSRTADNAINLDRLARYDTGNNTWDAITGSADVLTAARLTNATVQLGNELYIGGSFHGVDSGVAHYFTRYYLQRWIVPDASNDWHNNASWTTGAVPAANTNAVIPLGAGQVNITSADVTMNDLMFNSGTLTIGAGRTLTINGILGLNGGIINGDGTLVITSCKPDGIMGGSETAYIQTALVRCVGSPGAFSFPVGTANGYSPVNINVTSGTTQIAASVAQSNQPALNAATSLRRYWTLTSSGGTFTADLTFNYLDGDVFGNENNYRLIRVSGGTPSSFPNDCISGPACVDTTLNKATITGVGNFSDWTLGEPLAPTVSDGVVLGGIVDDNGNPVAGAVVRLSGTQNRKSITDANGNYRFDAVETGGFYTVTPSRANYSFIPANRSFSLVGNQIEAGFVAVADVSHSLNPLDTAEYFVRQHYLDFLGREPDEAGFNFWSEQILECGADLGCRERRRVNVSAAYFLSIEFQETGGLVDGLYRASYGRRPLYAEFMPDTRAVARGVVVGRGGWAQQLEANKQAFVDAWVQRATFLSIYGRLNNEAYVDELIAHSGVAFSQSERDSLVSGLDSRTSTRAKVLRQIAENDRFVNAKRNEAFVLMQYFGYLQRDPDESGYQFWLRKLNQFHGNFEQAEMVKAFLVSGEYRQRFGQP